MSPAKKKAEYKTASNNNGSIPELMKELWQAAVNARLDRAGGLQTLRFADHLPALPFDAVRKAP